jgi:diguanylate cyclase (GGDEF)-like protein
MPTPAHGPQLAAALAPGALVVVAVVLLTGLAGPADVAVDDLAQLLAALGAALACGRAAGRAVGRRRQAWVALSVGCAGWAAGQAVWTWYELVLGTGTPFPSPGDVGFLAFPVAAVVALVLHPTPSVTPGDQRRRLLDGVLVAASIALLSWVTALGAVVEQHADALSTAVAVAYPAGDVVALTMVVVLLSRATADRRALVLVGAGTAVIALADSAFLYLTSVDLYDSDLHLVGLGWACGFVLVGLGAGAACRDDGVAPTGTRSSGRAGLLPYAPIVLALGIAVGRALTGGSGGRVETALGVLVVGLVLLRQWALVRDHARLLDALAVREDELRHQAFHDGLTGLVNRALFRDRVAHGLAQHERSGEPLTVLFCDLDDFKLVNDTLGHATGDALLVEVAARLRTALRSGDTLARLGGDEFAVLLQGVGDAGEVAGALVATVRTPVVLDGRELVVRMSVGATTVASGARPAPSVDALLAQADTAMYAAKRDGGGTVRAFTPGMALAEVAEADRTGALADAIAAGDITLVYQPVVDVRTGRVEGVEALARWSYEGRPVPPDVFVALAERTGLIGPLTDLVLDTACAQAAAWLRSGVPAVRVGVNLSPSSITDPSLPEQVARCLARHGLTGTALLLEVTESGVLQDPEVARQVCTALRAQGVLLALDDFGSGFASLGHLNDLPLDVVKLDRSLLSGVGTDPGRTGFVGAVLRLGTDLGLLVVAEGVEEPEQLAGLRAMGMPLVQGYLLCRPQTAEQVTPLLGQRLVAPAPALV